MASPQGWPVLLFAAAMAGLLAQSGLLVIWLESEEYGHGLMVVAVLAYLVARRWPVYRPAQPGNAGAGIALALLASALVVLGGAAGIPLVAYYGSWLFALAAIVVAGGFGFLRKLLVPMLIVLLLFPLPNPLGPMLTAKLQLISSSLGVSVIRLFGGSVYLEGNVIELAGTKLLVAEACAGLRYLFPLMSLGAIAGLMLRAPIWMRWTVFLAAVPITVVMNSTRIAMTGFLVEADGNAHTEGFLHLFEGWAVFVVASILLLAVMRGLVALLPGRQRLLDAMFWRDDASAAPTAWTMGGRETKALWVVVALMVAAIAGGAALAGRGERTPGHKPLEDFPARLDQWTARTDRLPVMVEDVAGASEYFYGDYSDAAGEAVNAYISFYGNQRHGQIPHSPKVCIPGGGWVIESQGSVALAGPDGKPFGANRLVTVNGGARVVAYYWLKQGSRTYSEEALARLDLVRRSLLEDRTDGALVRLVTELRPGESLEAGDQRLQRFAADFVGVIPAYVPD